MSRRRLIVAISGASGAILGIRLLEALRELGTAETHLIITRWAQRTIEHETGYTVEAVRQLADVTHPADNQAAVISSGSYRTDGMAIIPCSVRALAAVASGMSYNLVTRAADVVIKEGRRLVLVVRETPLNAIHLENMLKLARLGVAVFPPVPAFYTHPATLQDVIDDTVARVLDQFGLDFPGARRWEGRLRRAGVPAAGEREE